MRLLPCLIAAGLLAATSTGCGSPERSSGGDTATHLDLDCSFEPTPPGEADLGDVTEIGIATITGHNPTDDVLEEVWIRYRLTGLGPDRGATGSTAAFVDYLLPGEHIAVWSSATTDDPPEGTFDGCEITRASLGSMDADPLLQPEGARCEVDRSGGGGEGIFTRVDMSAVDGFPSTADRYIGVRVLTADGARFDLLQEHLAPGETTADSFTLAPDGRASCDVLYVSDTAPL